MSLYDNLDLTDREYLKQTLERIREAIVETLALMTGREFELGEPDFDSDNVDALAEFLPDQTVITAGELVTGLEGKLTLAITGKKVIEIAGALTDLSREEIASRVGEGVTSQMLGHFQEVSNQMFANIGMFLTRLFDSEIAIELKELTTNDISEKQLEFVARTGLDESVVVKYDFSDGCAVVLFVPLAVAKELSTIGLPGLPKRSPEKRETGPPSKESLSNVSRLLKLQLPLIVKLAEKVESLDKVLNFSEGHIIEFEKSSDGLLELLVVNKVIGTGEAVKIGENFGIRIRDIGTPHDILKKLR
jgi:flagellar motor switch protein FliN/FliY